jgi:hypothetical protein
VIDHNKVVNTDQSDFPVLISGVYPFLATVANGGKVQNPNGWDIFFTADAAGQNKLDHEIDTYDPITGTASFWVRIPLLSHITDTVIYMWFGSSAVSSSQENKPGVWKDYVFVGHMGNASNPNLSDSVHPSAVPSTSSFKAGSGPSSLYGAIIDGGASWADYGTSADYQPVGPITVSAWVELNSSQIGKSICVNWWEIGGPPRDGYFLGISDSTPNTFKFGTGYSPDGTYNATNGATTLNVGQWYLVHGVYDTSAGTESLLVDGQPDAANAWSKPITYASDNRMVVGALHYQGGYAQEFDGAISEVRVSTKARSTDWIATEYNNQSSPSTFYNIGSNATAVTFSDPTSPVTQATFSQPGTYLLQLTANDTVYTVTSTVAVVANPEITTQNQPPVVTANPTLPAFAGTPVALTGTATDDGLPNGTLTVQWSILSGPGTVTFSNASSAASTAIFSVVGTYVLQLSAND